VNGFPHGGLRDAMFPRQRFDRHAGDLFACGTYDSWCQLPTSRAATSSASAFDHVLHILSVSSDPKVGRVAARAHVARMQNKKTRRNLSVRDDVGVPMRAQLLAVGVEVPVAACVE
jgi:hypothetical protein